MDANDDARRELSERVKKDSLWPLLETRPGGYALMVVVHGDGDLGPLVADDLLRTGRFAFMAKLAPHLPGDPQQQQPAGQDQPDDLEQLGDDQGEADAQHQGSDDADEDDLAPLVGRQSSRQGADDDRIVAGQHQVDHQHLEEGGEGRRLGDVGKIVDDRGPHFRRAAKAPGRTGARTGDQKFNHQLPLPCCQRPS